MRRWLPTLSVILTGAAGLLAACSPIGALNATVSTRDVTLVPNIHYESGPLAGNPRLRLDVYRPSQIAGPLPIVVFVYGGSWEYGRRQDYLFVAEALARRGIIVMVPDYRVYPEVRFPDFLDDTAHAVAFAHRTAASWGGDPRRVFVVGHSAGAYNALMLALDPGYLAAAGDDRNALAGTVGISGPYDFLPIQRPDVKAVFSSAPDLSVTQPIGYADGRNRPLLLLQGAADDTVEPRNTTALAARIEAHGGPVAVRIYPGVGHIGIAAAFAPLFRDRAPTLDDVARFVADPANEAPVEP